MSKKRKIPTREDWGDFSGGDLDVKYCYENCFGGKNLEEVQEYFKTGVIDRADELLHMPAIPFQYYIFAFQIFVESEDFDEHYSFDAPSIYLDLIRSKLEKFPIHILPIINELMPFVENIANNQSKFDTDKEIFGDFQQKLADIKELINQSLK